MGTALDGTAADAPLDRALARARWGLTLRSLCIAAGASAGAGLGIVALGLAGGLPWATADLCLSAACGAGAAFGMAWKRPRPAAVAGNLDAVLGTQAFGAAFAGGGLDGARSPMGNLTAREAVNVLGQRDPVKLFLRDWNLALAGPAIGVALCLLAPIFARSAEGRSSGAGAQRAEALAAIRVTGVMLLTKAPSPGTRAAAQQVLTSADRAAMALTRGERAAADSDLARAVESLTAGAGSTGSGGAGDLAAAQARLRDFAAREGAVARASRIDGAAAHPSGPGTPESAPHSAPTSAPGVSAVTLSGPYSGATAEAVARAPAWPSRFDSVVRLYFEGAASAPARPGDETYESKPKNQR